MIELIKLRDSKLQDVKQLSFCDADLMYGEIYNYLLMGNVVDAKKALIVLPKYLESIGKSKYEFLIRGLIEICCMEINWDNTFYLPALFLYRLKVGIFQLDFTFFVEKLKDALSYERKDVALKYLSILQGISELGVLVSGVEIKKLRTIYVDLVALMMKKDFVLISHYLSVFMVRMIIIMV